jgi:hypothetical protein
VLYTWPSAEMIAGAKICIACTDVCSILEVLVPDTSCLYAVLDTCWKMQSDNP